MVLMLFHNKLYVDEDISKQKKKIMRRLKHNKETIGVYIITLSLNPEDELDIYPSYVLRKKEYIDKNIIVVGIASDKENAMELLVKMTDDCFKEMGKIFFRQFFRL